VRRAQTEDGCNGNGNGHFPTAPKKKMKRNTKNQGEEKATAAEDSRQARCGKSHF